VDSKSFKVWIRSVLGPFFLATLSFLIYAVKLVWTFETTLIEFKVCTGTSKLFNAKLGVYMSSVLKSGIA